MSGREPLAFELALDPVEEAFDGRSAVSEPIQLLALPGQVLITDLLLDAVEHLDLSECLFGAGGL